MPFNFLGSQVLYPREKLCPRQKESWTSNVTDFVLGKKHYWNLPASGELNTPFGVLPLPYRSILVASSSSLQGLQIRTGASPWPLKTCRCNVQLLQKRPPHLRQWCYIPLPCQKLQIDLEATELYYKTRWNAIKINVAHYHRKSKVSFQQLWTLKSRVWTGWANTWLLSRTRLQPPQIEIWIRLTSWLLLRGLWRKPETVKSWQQLGVHFLEILSLLKMSY